MNLNPKDLFEYMARQFAVLFVLIWIFLLVGCGGSKIKASHQIKSSHSLKSLDGIGEERDGNLTSNTLTSYSMDRVLYTPIDPNQPMYVPDASGNMHAIKNAKAEYINLKKDKKESLAASQKVIKKRTTKVSVETDQDEKTKDVERENIGRATASLIFWVVVTLAVLLILWVKRTSIIKLIRKWIGI